jgi:hypothetical protein
MRGLLQLSLPHWSRHMLQKRTVRPRERNSNSFRHSVLFNLRLPFQSVGQALLPMYENTALTMPFFALRAGTARTAILKRFKIRQENHFQPPAAAASVRFVVVLLLFFFRVHIASISPCAIRIRAYLRPLVQRRHIHSVCPYVCSSLGITQYNHISITQDYLI